MGGRAEDGRGEGVYRGLGKVLGDEMDADGTQERLEQSTLDAIYNNQPALIDSLPFQPDDHGLVKRTAGHLMGKLLREIPGLLGTGGSAGISHQLLVQRQAGPLGRALLISGRAGQKGARQL